MNYRIGMLVENTGAPHLGPGKIVHISGDRLHIVFRDVEEDMARVFRADVAALRILDRQTDSILDNLPPLIEKGGRWVLPNKRLTLESLKRAFLHEFPAGFSDPQYFQRERDYKLTAHLKFQQLLGLDHARQLLSAGDLRTLAAKALQVLSAVNLLARFESAAFHDAMQSDVAVRDLFSSLFDVLDSESGSAELFQKYFNAVTSLPADRGRVASWPVATVFPYLAAPTRFMFLKPEVTKNAAETLGFDLRYDASPNWPTYAALQRLGVVYLDLLRPLGARDFIDVQSFIYVCCGGYDHVRATTGTVK